MFIQKLLKIIGNGILFLLSTLFFLIFIFIGYIAYQFTIEADKATDVMVKEKSIKERKAQNKMNFVEDCKRELGYIKCLEIWHSSNK